MPVTTSAPRTPAGSGASRGRRPARAIVAAAAAATLLAACGGGTGAGGQPTAQVTATAAASPGATASSSPGRSAGRRPPIVAVTTAGALVLLSRRSGAIARTLVRSGVLGDEISVAGDRTAVYFAHSDGRCASQIESVPVGGGSPVVITSGSLPAVSPDGSKLAFAREPLRATGCPPGQADETSQYKLVVRTLSTGAETTYPMQPAAQSTGLPAPISHLSWA